MIRARLPLLAGLLAILFATGCGNPAPKEMASAAAAAAPSIPVSGEEPAAPSPPPPVEGVVLHEWGTFTTVAGAAGEQVVWYSFYDTSYQEPLPSFVQADRSVTKTTRGMGFTVRMETPVIYFYAANPQDVALKVAITEGSMTEWYPNVPNGKNFMQVVRELDWGTFRIEPGATPEFPRDPNGKGAHYYEARATDAAPVAVPLDKAMQREKFLFYRGAGRFDLPLHPRMDGERLVLANAGAEPLGSAVVFERRDGRIGFSVHSGVDKELTVDRPVLDGGEERLPELYKELEAILVREGLYPREARAMVNTWKHTWFEDGLRVFTCVPRARTDELLPLTVEPPPVASVRVMMHRAEVLTPERLERVLSIVKGLPEDGKEREKAFRERIGSDGRFGTAIHARLLEQAKDEDLKQKISAVMW